jgi:hypothetical protein
MAKKVKSQPDVPRDALTDVLGKAMAGMPCANRETAAEKAAAHAWMEKERVLNGPRRLRNLEKARKAFAEIRCGPGAKEAGLVPRRFRGRGIGQGSCCAIVEHMDGVQMPPEDNSEKFDPQKMMSIVERLNAEGRMPTLEKIDSVLREFRKEYQDKDKVPAARAKK